MSLGLSPTIGFSPAATAAAPAALLPIGSQIVFFGDGTGSEAAAPGLRNYPTWTVWLLNGRVFPGPAYIQCASGGDLDTTFARIAPALGHQADIAVFASQGHNDPVMSTDPDLTSTYLDKWKRNLDAWMTGNTVATLIPICTTIKSNVAGETLTASVGGTIRDRVNALQKAYITTKIAGDARAFVIDIYTTYDPTNMSSDAGGFQTHPDMRGGYAIGLAIANALDSRVVAKTRDEIQAMLATTTYPGLSGTQFDTDTLLQGGTAGTKAGSVTPTGNYPTGKRITNNLTNGTSVAVACSIDASPGTYSIAVVAVSGTPAAETTIVMDDTASITATGTTPGQYAVAAWGVKVDDGAGGAPTGVRSLCATFSNYGNSGSAGTDATTITMAQKVDTVMFAAPKSMYISSGPFAGNPAFTARFAASALTTTLKLDRPTLHTVSTRTRSAPCYLGTDTITTANYMIRVVTATGVMTTRVNVACASTANLTLSGEQTIDGVLTSASRVLVKNQTTTANNGIYVTAAGAWSRATDYDSDAEIRSTVVNITAGTTLSGQLWQSTNGSAITVGTTALTFATYQVRYETGQWAPYGLTESDFSARRIYNGGSATVGTGVLVATLTGSTWTWAVDPATVANGANLYAELDVNNGVGGTITARAATAYVAA